MADIKTVDARGLSCPQPVILTRNALNDSDQVVTLVDNETAQHNVTRMVEKAGCTVSVETRADDIVLHISKGEVSPAATYEIQPQMSITGPLVLLIPGEFMGRGDEDLGHILIRGFFHTLGEVEPAPDVIIFINRGVKLVIGGSPVLDDLEQLRARGIEILACGTCLKHYGLADRIAVGEISNMYTIAETLLNAAKVISL